MAKHRAYRSKRTVIHTRVIRPIDAPPFSAYECSDDTCWVYEAKTGEWKQFEPIPGTKLEPVPVEAVE